MHPRAGGNYYFDIARTIQEMKDIAVPSSRLVQVKNIAEIGTDTKRSEPDVKMTSKGGKGMNGLHPYVRRLPQAKEAKHST